MTTLEQLRALARLRDSGALSVAEHDARRAALLDAIPESEIVEAPPAGTRRSPSPWPFRLLALATGLAVPVVILGGLTWSSAGMVAILGMALATARAHSLAERD